MNHSQIKNNFNKTLNGPLLIKQNLYSDNRGFFMESWNQREFDKLVNKKNNFVQDNHSMSYKNVLRGMHYQLEPYTQAKLIRCISGEIYDVIVDLREDSPTFLSYAGIKLDNVEKQQLWVPSGFAHGFLTISDKAEINYKTNSYWSKDHERTLNWEDPLINIKWPLKDKKPLLSEKDKNAPKFNKIEKYDFFK